MPKICPNCKTESDDAYQFCPNCGGALPDRETDSPAAPSPVCCPNCGGTLTADDRFCKSCGAPAPAEASGSESFAPMSPRPAVPAPEMKKKTGLRRQRTADFYFDLDDGRGDRHRDPRRARGRQFL